MARGIYLGFVFLMFLCLVQLSIQNVRHGFPPEMLSVYSGDQVASGQPIVMHNPGNDHSHGRTKRDAPSKPILGPIGSAAGGSASNRNISTVVSLY